MAHFSENSTPLAINNILIESIDSLIDKTRHFADVCVLRLPYARPNEYGYRLIGLEQLVANVAANLDADATLITLGETIDLVRVHTAAASFMQYHHLIAIKRASPVVIGGLYALPNYHFGALIHTGYKSSLRHSKTRIRYTYCPACNKTTKDYGGKKHTYHRDGTLISDVWRDVACDLDDDLTGIITRFADVFGTEPYRELRVLDCRSLELKRAPIVPIEPAISKSGKIQELNQTMVNKLFRKDCMKQLSIIPDDSVDFVFADPPYNLGKKYIGYTDDLDVTKYFWWCDKWIGELARVLRPNRTCAILNIPLWAIRHFIYLEQILNFQSWIVWDALSYPVRLIMPSHYAILCFSKGNPRMLPGLTNKDKETSVFRAMDTYEHLEPLAEGFCLRAKCVAARREMHFNDRGPLTDLWWDIHRVKHNTRRVDHPCQLPPQLMRRLISLFTKPEEIVLDCFNGAGTTTLAAHQLGRRYIGIENSNKYHNIAVARHREILSGVDPFRKANRILTAKNSPVPRMPKRKYKVNKKTLQLEIRRIADELGRLPNRDEVIKYGKYSIEYYDDYFSSWGEVCAAARTTGMSENRIPALTKLKTKQPYLFDPEKVTAK